MSKIITSDTPMNRNNMINAFVLPSDGDKEKMLLVGHVNVDIHTGKITRVFYKNGNHHMRILNKLRHQLIFNKHKIPRYVEVEYHKTIYASVKDEHNIVTSNNLLVNLGIVTKAQTTEI